MNIKKANESDLEVILSLVLEFQEYLDIQNNVMYSPPSSAKFERIKEKINETLKSHDNIILLAKKDNHVIGYLFLHLLPNIRRGYDQAFIIDLYVTQKLQSKGVGTLLLDAAKQLCKKSDISVIKLTSDFSLENAHRFYEKNGGKFTEKMFRFDLE